MLMKNRVRVTEAMVADTRPMIHYAERVSSMSSMRASEMGAALELLHDGTDSAKPMVSTNNDKFAKKNAENLSTFQRQRCPDKHMECPAMLSVTFPPGCNFTISHA